MNVANPRARRAAITREFSKISAGSYQLYLRADLTRYAATLAAALRELGAAGAPGAGNRGGGFRLALPAGPELFVRRARRSRRCSARGCTILTLTSIISSSPRAARASDRKSVV